MRVNPDIPAALQQVIHRALEKDRNLRYQHAADMRAELQRLQARHGVEPQALRKKRQGSWRLPATRICPRPASRGRRIPSAQTSGLRPQRVSKIIDSLAVLPFENASGDPEHEYLSDGITGSLINHSGDSAKTASDGAEHGLRYKGREIDPQAVGRDLNVRAVLTGRMMQSGGSLRIGTELVDVATGSQLWGGQYDRKPGDIFAVQDEISNEISGKLRLQLTRAEKKQLTKRHTEEREAYQLYLKAVITGTDGPKKGFTRLSSTFSRQSIKIQRTPSPTLVWPIAMCSWDGTAICRRRKRSRKERRRR